MLLHLLHGIFFSGMVLHWWLKQMVSIGQVDMMVAHCCCCGAFLTVVVRCYGGNSSSIQCH